jgi:hypothetical protein
MAEKKPVNLIAFDIETTSLGGDPVYWSWASGDDQGGEAVEGSAEFTRRFAERFLTPSYSGAVIVAHNGLRFDYLRLDYHYLIEQGYSIKVWKSRTSIRGMDVSKNKRTWKLRDSVTWSPSTLADFVTTFAPSGFRKMESPDWESENFSVLNPDHVRYALNDSVVLYEAVCGYNRFLSEHFSIDVRKAVTLSGFAVKALKQHVGGSVPDWPLMADPLGRESYHGALTCAFQVGTFRDLVYLDINSSYASVMLEHDLPTGLPFRVAPSIKIAVPHLVAATVEIPSGVFPCLVSRSDTGAHSRVGGMVTGIYWDFELALQQELGGIIRAVHARYVFPTVWDGCRRFVHRLAEIRSRDYHGPVGQLAKLMQNSLYGKFAAFPDDRLVIVAEDPPPEGVPFIGPGSDPVPFFWSVPSRRKSSSRVYWGSFITARAREKLLRYLMRMPFNDWIYSDTDSLLVPKRYLSRYRDVIGTSYGQLKVEGEMSEFEVRAAKVYVGKLADGTLRFKAKGIPKRLRREAFDKGKVHYEQSVSLSVSMSGKLRTKNKPDSYTKIAQRTLSGPQSCISGSYKNNRWQPELADGRGFDPQKLGAYAFDKKVKP